MASVTLPDGKGHSTIGMTLDTYSHVLPSMLEDALAGLDTMLQA
ncbi:MAG TPA: hypothetical protein VFB12_09055 [Ktedonobacteraceae bacterium]|nr:hypothetical protein [Ktedonobacteraceae bacterium]